MQQNIPTKEQTILHELVHSWQPQMVISKIIPLKADASMRRYFRIYLDSGATLIGMLFDSVKAPEVGIAPNLPADEAYAELTSYFKRSNIPVPDCFATNLNSHVLLIEDLGDELLGDAPNKAKYCLQAIEIISALQKLPVKDNIIAFKRSFTKDVFIAEMQEFNEFFLELKGLKTELEITTKHAMQILAEELMQIPFCLAHRDFHLWNLMLKQDKVYLIDFQDALLAPYTYDLISLLNDRDSDKLLGPALYAELKQAFIKSLKDNDRNFEVDFQLTSLQRDLKVVGRFAKLASARGLQQYLKWIPGTLARIKTNFKLLANSNKNFIEISRQLAKLNE